MGSVVVVEDVVGIEEVSSAEEVFLGADLEVAFIVEYGTVLGIRSERNSRLSACDTAVAVIGKVEVSFDGMWREGMW